MPRATLNAADPVCANGDVDPSRVPTVDTKIASLARVASLPVVSTASSTHASQARENWGFHVPDPFTRSFERAATVPSELIGQTSGLGPVVWVRSDLWTDRRVLTTLRRAAAGARAGEFTFRELARPDVLAYWVTGPGAIAGGLPENARLLGVLSSGVPLPIPAAARSETGRFGLYSLADHEVVAVSNSSTVPQD